MKSLADLQKLREQAQKRVQLRQSGQEDYRVVVGMATCGIAAGARPVLAAFTKEVTDRNLPVVVTQTGCLGMCSLEPLVEVFDAKGNKTTYVHMTPEKVVEVVRSHLLNGEIVEEFTVAK